MRMQSAVPTLGSTLRIVISAMTAVGIGVAVHARQAQSPAPVGAPAQQKPCPPPARGGQPPDDGRVCDERGAIVGYTKLAEIPGTPWVIHDNGRPRPRVVTPGSTPGAPPADAIVLFDGKDLSKWGQMVNGQLVDTKWPVRDGYFETGAGSGSMLTREKFGDVQLHLEFMTPSPAKGASQDRGNSGVTFMQRYEIQVLDSFENLTYADGQAAAIYGQDPPLVNAARRPGEWQTYDIVFEAPRFNGTQLAKPAYFTVFWNGIVVHNRRAVMGPTSPTTTIHQYVPHDAELPLTLQDHAHPVRYRNIWIRRLTGYDQ